MKLAKFVEDEISSIISYSECFLSAVKRMPFTNLCKILHLLVWARSVGFCSWPAKLLMYDGEKAHVRYFGEYKNDKIPINNCLLYSHQVPFDNEEFSKSQDEFDIALKEVNIYINNIKKVYGNFVFGNNDVLDANFNLSHSIEKIKDY